MNDRIKVLHCLTCRSSFRGLNPYPVYDRHMADHRASQVQAVVSS